MRRPLCCKQGGAIFLLDKTAFFCYTVIDAKVFFKQNSDLRNKKGGISMKKRVFWLLLLILSLSLILSACDAGHTYEEVAPPNKGYGNDGATSTDAVISNARKIITTVNETVETKHYDEFIAGLKTAVAEEGGYFVSSRYNGNGVDEYGTRTASFEIRIPADRLTDFTGKVGKLGTVTQHNETANDVTMSYLDIESRISVLAAEETALLAMLEDAQSTSEMLTIRQNLSEVQGNLASLRAQKANYDTLVAYSTVHLSVKEVEVERSADEGFFDEVGKSFMSSLSAIGEIFRALAIFFLGGAPFWILLALIGVAIFVIIRLATRRSRREAKAAAQKAEETKEEK